MASSATNHVHQNDGSESARSNISIMEMEKTDDSIGSESWRSAENMEEGNKTGVVLTWKEVGVTVSDAKNGGRRSILQGVTGYALPGELLAIMGPSGSGKSTLLDALAGRLDPKTWQVGEILINGRKQALAYGTSAYVTQDDVLIMTLTVREAVYYSAQLQLPDSMSKLEKIERANTTIREMGLQDAMDTRIGGWGEKGISGGQKKRVSICIELLTRPELLFLDEPTSGLDSAASYYVMKRIAELNNKDGIRRTIIASIHQPSSEVFQLFDNLCLMSTGCTVYFGPASAANEFFASNGFPCPSLQNPSDHFLKTLNGDFDKDSENGISQAIAREEAINLLQKAYKSSQTCQEVQTRVSKITTDNEFLERKRKRHGGFLTQSVFLTRRSFVNMYRDLGYYWLRLVIYIAVAIGLASAFYDLESNYGSYQARANLLEFVVTFLTFMAIGGFPSFVEDMKVFERERLNGHYGVSIFVISNTLSPIPFLLLISFIPGAIAYYIPGLHKGFEYFLYFALVLFACMVLVESLMMIIASIVPNFLMGIITGAGVQGLMILGSGVFRLTNDLPKPFWKYPLYYIAFQKYAFQGMFKNEFDGGIYLTRVSGPMDGWRTNILTGQEILRDIWGIEMQYSKWIDLAILLGMVVIYRLIFFTCIKMGERFKLLVAAMKALPSKKATQVMEISSTNS